MDDERFRDWFSHVDELTATQRMAVAAVLSDPPEGAASLAAIDLGVDHERRCRHCGAGGAVSRGTARGLRRVRCKACRKRFGALTGTALSGLHHEERWLAFGASPGAGETIREAAERCGIAPRTTPRWRHRFLAAVRQAPDRLAGIVEALETVVLESRKEERKLDRTRRRCGGTVRKPGLARARADPGRRRPCGRDPQPYPARPQRRQREGGAGAGRRTGCDARLRRQPLLSARCGGARHPTREHQRFCQRAGPGARPIQTVNSRHSQIKGVLRGFRGISPRTSTAI